MRRRIFTLIIGLCMAFAASAATGDVVKMVDLSNSSAYTTEDVVSVVDGAVVVKGVYANWTMHGITLTTPFELGKYTKFQAKINVPAVNHTVYVKAFDAAGTTLFEGSVAWPPADATTMNTWIQGANIDLLQPHDDGSKTRKTGIVSKMVFMTYQTDSWGPGADDMEFSVKDFECVEGEDVAAPKNNTPRLTYSSAKATEGMEIDGLDNDAAYDLVEFSPIDQINSGSGSGIMAEWASLWDNDNLYFYFYVEDDKVIAWDNEKFVDWQGDGFQFYLDVKDRRIDGLTFGKMTGTSINPGRETDAAATANFGFQASLAGAMGGFETEAKQGAVINASGYTIEVAYPWKGLCAGAMDASEIDNWVATNVKAGLEISFDIQLNDNDGNGARDNMISWCSTPKEPWGNSGTWGAIKLTDGTNSVNELAKSKISVYPNNVNSTFTVEMKNVRSISITSVTGATVKTVATSTDKTNVNVSSLTKGIYFVRAINSNGEVAVSKIVKE